MNAKVDVELLILYYFEVQITITRVTGPGSRDYQA